MARSGDLLGAPGAARDIVEAVRHNDVSDW
jgi:hypothetical protein